MYCAIKIGMFLITISSFIKIKTVLKQHNFIS